MTIKPSSTTAGLYSSSACQTENERQWFQPGRTRRAPKLTAAFAPFSSLRYLWVGKDDVGRVETAQKVRDFHHRRGRVVDAEVRQSGSIHGPPVGDIGQEHFLCFEKIMRISIIFPKACAGNSSFFGEPG